MLSVHRADLLVHSAGLIGLGVGLTADWPLMWPAALAAGHTFVCVKAVPAIGAAAADASCAFLPRTRSRAAIRACSSLEPAPCTGSSFMRAPLARLLCPNCRSQLTAAKGGYAYTPVTCMARDKFGVASVR